MTTCSRISFCNLMTSVLTVLEIYSELDYISIFNFLLTIENNFLNNLKIFTFLFVYSAGCAPYRLISYIRLFTSRREVFNAWHNLTYDVVIPFDVIKTCRSVLPPCSRNTMRNYMTDVNNALMCDSIYISVTARHYLLRHTESFSVNYVASAMSGSLLASSLTFKSRFFLFIGFTQTLLNKPAIFRFPFTGIFVPRFCTHSLSNSCSLMSALWYIHFWTDYLRFAAWDIVFDPHFLSI